MKKLIVGFLATLAIACGTKQAPRNPQPPPSEKQFHSEEEAKMAKIDASRRLGAPRAAGSGTVKPNTTYKIGADHDRKNVTEFRLEKAGAVIQTKPGNVTDLSFDLPGDPEGSYAYRVIAVRKVPAGPFESISDPYPVTVTAGTPLPISFTVPAINPNETFTMFRIYENETVIATKSASEVTGGVVTFSISNLSAGVHTLRNSVVSNYSVDTDLIAASDVFTVISTSQVAQAISASPAPISPGKSQTITWSCISDCGTIGKDWIGLFRKGGGTGEDIWWPGSYLKVPGSGTLLHDAPTQPGDYEWRYCLNDGYNCPAVFPFSVVSTNPPANCVLSEWTNWTVVKDWAPINTTQEQRTLQRQKTVVTPESNGGTCPLPDSPERLETKIETRDITPPPPPLSVFSVEVLTTQCRFTARDKSPYTGGGGRVQFRESGSSFGQAVTTPDTEGWYVRTALRAAGTRKFEARWTKTGEPAVNREFTVTCPPATK